MTSSQERDSSFLTRESAVLARAAAESPSLEVVGECGADLCRCNNGSLHLSRDERGANATVATEESAILPPRAASPTPSIALTVPFIARRIMAEEGK